MINKDFYDQWYNAKHLSPLWPKLTPTIIFTNENTYGANRGIVSGLSLNEMRFLSTININCY